MVQWQQLELALTHQVDDGFEDLDEVDILALTQRFDLLMVSLPVSEQLRVGGLFMDRLAELYQSRAMLLLDDWEEKYNSQGPVFDASILDGLVRESQLVDLSEFVKSSRRIRSPKVTGPLDDEDSVFLELDVEQAIALAEQDQDEKVDLSHPEDVSAWSSQIQQWFEKHPQAIPLWELQQALQMPWVELCLGVLLGGFGLEQRGSFYELGTIWISLLETSK